MTKKDFEVIAEIIGTCYQSKNHGGGREEKIDTILKRTNPNYSPARFWGAVEKYAKMEN